MSAPPAVHGIHWESWRLSEEADRRFRWVVLFVGLPVLILSIIIPLLDFEDHVKGNGSFNGTQYVQLLPEQAELAPVAEEPKPAEKNDVAPPQQAAPVKPTVKPVENKPTAPVNPTPTKTARDVAAQSGLMQFKDQLADLRTGTLNTTQPLSDNQISSKGGIGASGGAGSSGETIASSAASGSGGIGGTGTAAVTTTQSGSGIGERRTSTVKSNIGAGADRSRPGNNGDKLASARNYNEIQLVFDRNKAAFYAIFSRAARENPALGSGKVVVSITIAPNGSVTECHIVSSSFNDPDIDAKIVQRVKLLTFSAKDVPSYTYPNYPINYLP